ncbi:unnamed protein product [Amoebophrya sp. A25]|nr:unnamed protein product [Amoebophrya sp. A25]|eukprot:GSA25T00022501001.1
MDSLELEACRLLVAKVSKQDLDKSGLLSENMANRNVEGVKFLLDFGASLDHHAEEVTRFFASLSLSEAQDFKTHVPRAYPYLLPCFVRSASLRDVRECVESGRLDINAGVSLDGSHANFVSVVSTFRNNINAVMALMSDGAKCDVLGIHVHNESALRRFVHDRQNAHTTLSNKIICRNVQRAYKMAGGKDRKLLDLEELKDEISGLSDACWEKVLRSSWLEEEVKMSTPLAASVKRFVLDAVDRLGQLRGDDFSPSPLVSSGQEALELVYRALEVAFSKGLDYDHGKDVLAPLAGALLQTETEYGWRGGRSCPQGSMAMVLQVLEGRVEETEKEAEAEKKENAPCSLADWKGWLQACFDAGKCEHLYHEVQSRLLEYGYADRLQNIYEKIVEGDHYQFYVNKLRGLVFQMLCEEFSQDLAKRRLERDENNLRQLVEHLGHVANLFTEVCETNMLNVIEPVAKEPQYNIHQTVSASTTIKSSKCAGARPRQN